MNPDFYGLIELILVVGIVVGFGVWQLASLRRLAKRRPSPPAGKGSDDSPA
jgi:hypothetical protein